MEELALKKDIKEQKDNSLLEIKLFQNKNRTFENVENFFVTIIDSYNEIKQNIDPKEVYVVKFTQEQLDKFNRGDINFQKTADMKSLLPNFVSKGTNNDIVSMARLEKIVLDNPEAFKNVVSNVNRLVEIKKVGDLDLYCQKLNRLL